MSHKVMRLIKQIIVLFIGSSLFAAPALAVILIRDAEIEHTLREYTTPIFEVAGLNPQAVKLFIVQDSAINAFVAGGENIFIHTGLITASTSPAMLLGALAHETGHIVGGHLARGTEKLKDAQLGMVLSMVLGAATAAATGKTGAAAAVISGGQHSIQRNLLAFSRANEQSADQAGMSYLDKLHISTSGMRDLLELLRRNEQRQFGTVDPYSITHPLSKERIADVRSHVENSTIPQGQYPKRDELMQQRMVAKLQGFIDAPQKTLARYSKHDTSVPARMARAIAYHRQANLAQALPEMDSLLKDSPNDPFFNELKGQILFENAKVKEALPYYQKAVDYYPSSSLLLTDLARIQLAANQALQAMNNLEKATRLDNTNSESWRLLATAYGAQNNKSMASLALAEEGLLQNNPDAATQYVEKALEELKAGTPAYLRAQDVKNRALELKKENQK